jgi:polyphosphate glucokinase
VGQRRFGVDIGGTGIKGATVDISTGVLVSDRVRLLTPKPATPAAIVPVVAGLVRGAAYDGPIGCAFPAVVKNGVAETAANIDHSWIGASVASAVSAELAGAAVTVLNDADAAGIGSALFVDGRLVPNTEFGHLEVDGHVAETRVSEVVREDEDLSRKQWAKRFNRYLEVLEGLIWPDLIIIGGGVSKAPEKFMPLLESTTKVVPATLANEAGIIGAALAAK